MVKICKARNNAGLLVSAGMSRLYFLSLLLLRGKQALHAVDGSNYKNKESENTTGLLGSSQCPQAVGSSSHSPHLCVGGWFGALEKHPQASTRESLSFSLSRRERQGKEERVSWTPHRSDPIASHLRSVLWEFGAEAGAGKGRDALALGFGQLLAVWPGRVSPPLSLNSSPENWANQVPLPGLPEERER